ncbi:unnamed protein product [Cuscuta epithymum]|uniref:Uncharacterized protein n=1 Tax=Cuscuta epithymum TaxID=186058 RepID=A0AAV0FXP9_9ASTE|nr:unnamed protein product [Cuscuta epithymum]
MLRYERTKLVAEQSREPRRSELEKRMEAWEQEMRAMMSNFATTMKEQIQSNIEASIAAAMEEQIQSWRSSRPQQHHHLGQSCCPASNSSQMRTKSLVASPSSSQFFTSRISSPSASRTSALSSVPTVSHVEVPRSQSTTSSLSVVLSSQDSSESPAASQSSSSSSPLLSHQSTSQTSFPGSQSLTAASSSPSPTAASPSSLRTVSTRRSSSPLQSASQRANSQHHRTKESEHLAASEGKYDHSSSSMGQDSSRRDIGAGSTVELPWFNGEKVDKWIVKMEEYFRLKSTAEGRKVEIAEEAMEEEAFDWFEGWQFQTREYSWKALKESMTRHFQPTSSLNTGNQYTRSQRTSLSSQSSTRTTVFPCSSTSKVYSLSSSQVSSQSQAAAHCVLAPAPADSHTSQAPPLRLESVNLLQPSCVDRSVSRARANAKKLNEGNDESQEKLPADSLTWQASQLSSEFINQPRPISEDRFIDEDERRDERSAGVNQLSSALEYESVEDKIGGSELENPEVSDSKLLMTKLLVPETHVGITGDPVTTELPVDRTQSGSGMDRRGSTEFVIGSDGHVKLDERRRRFQEFIDVNSPSMILLLSTRDGEWGIYLSSLKSEKHLESGETALESIFNSKILDRVQQFVSEKRKSYVHIDGQISIRSFYNSKEAAERVHRQEQKNAVNLYILCAKDASDEVHWQNLYKNLHQVSSALNGRYEAAQKIEDDIVSYLERTAGIDVSNSEHLMDLSLKTEAANYIKVAMELLGGMKNPYRPYQWTVYTYNSPMMQSKEETDELDIRLEMISLLGGLFAISKCEIQEVFYLVVMEVLRRSTERTVQVWMGALKKVIICWLCDPFRDETPQILSILEKILRNYDEDLGNQVAAVLYDVAAEITTRAAGFYIAEPLHDDIGYKEEASSVIPGNVYNQFLLRFAVKDVMMKVKEMKLLDQKPRRYWEGRGSRMKRKFKIKAVSYYPP